MNRIKGTIAALPQPHATLREIVYVCEFSGYRGMGLAKLIDETKNLVNAIAHAQNIFKDVSLTEMSYCAIGCLHFFESIARAFQDLFPGLAKFNQEPFSKHFPKDLSECELYNCLQNIVDLCGQNGDKLQQYQNQNRFILHFLLENKAAETEIFYIGSWIDDNELFFEDLRYALRDIVDFSQNEGCMMTWLGDEYTPCLIANRTDQQACQPASVATPVEQASPITDCRLSEVRQWLEDSMAKGESFISLRVDIVADLVARINVEESDDVLHAYRNARVFSAQVACKR